MWSTLSVEERRGSRIRGWVLQARHKGKKMENRMKRAFSNFRNRLDGSVRYVKAGARYHGAEMEIGAERLLQRLLDWG
jgi:hypothetical protein